MSDTTEPKPHYHGHRERLRGKLLKQGESALADYEVLELLLCAFIPRRDVKPIAKALIQTFGSLSGVFAAPPRKLMQVDGVGETVAAYLKAVHAAHIRASADTVKTAPVLSSWSAVESYLRISLQHETTEQFRVLYLDRKNNLITDMKLGQGTVDHAPVYPREVARHALEHAASSLILVHNHPSGDPTPSQADISMTREIIDALTALEITLHDHIVVGRQGAFSMKTAGLI